MSSIRHQIPQRYVGMVLSALALAALSTPIALAASQDRPAKPSPIQVRIAGHLRTLLPKDLNAQETTAALQLPANAQARVLPGAPIAPAHALDPNQTYHLSARVIVELAPGTRFPPQVQGARRSFPITKDGRFLVIETNSVARALELSARLQRDPRYTNVTIDHTQPRTLRVLPSDPLIPNQWHLSNAIDPLFDINVEPAWNQGLTGAGIDVGIVEGGWQYNHPDLAANHNASVTQPGGTSTFHGTSTAGLVGMVANNSIGGAGVAYNAKISGQIFGSASQDAAALLFANNVIDIKSNSWGPQDNGAFWTIEPIQLAALSDSALLGRGGLGTILVWAAGNGDITDRVDYDPWASSRYTIAVGAIGDNDFRSFYNERGSSMLIVATSNGNSRSISTTTTTSTYTNSFGGTSATSPITAGAIALILEANPNLTWRDVQHILIQSARKNDPTSLGWTLNGAGHDISYDYGFGALDVDAATILAASWSNVAPYVTVETPVVPVAQAIPDNNPTGVSVNVNMPNDIIIEHVELITNVTMPRPEDLVITITSPTGSQSIVSAQRRTAFSNPSPPNLTNYLFTSFRHWDEHSAGTWTVSISDGFLLQTATWNDFQLRFHGTAINSCLPDLTTTNTNPGDPGYGQPDGAVNGADISYYVENWFLGNAAIADLTTTNTNPGDPGYGIPDTFVNGADISYYVNQWFNGCP